LNDDEGSRYDQDQGMGQSQVDLTHYGQSLAQIERFERVEVSDDDDDEDNQDPNDEDRGKISGKHTFFREK
jgi:hypothetical protein